MKSNDSINQLIHLNSQELKQDQLLLKQVEAEKKSLIQILQAERKRFLLLRKERDLCLKENGLEDLAFYDDTLHTLNQRLFDLYHAFQEKEKEEKNLTHRIQLKKQEGRKFEKLKRRRQKQVEQRENKFWEEKQNEIYHFQNLRTKK